MAKRSKSAPLSQPAPQVQDFRSLLAQALDQKDSLGRKWGGARWGCYAFYDYDREPIYVGQTNERLSTRVRRHLTNQRSDAVAMRILDVLEVAEMELWPLWEYEGLSQKTSAKSELEAAKARLNSVEYSAYLRAINRSRFHAILNEQIPPVSPVIELPPSQRFALISEETRKERGHLDIRLARRTETLARLSAVAHERGEVSIGLRRVMVVQAVRVAHLAAARLAAVEGRGAPPASLIDISALVGTVLQEHQEEFPDEEAD
ncbi:GIY-YIG nuclease family protein [Streptomyces californicus]|uniref:GIY-YIG nuclease family protein n=1 Tax=Streptomyces californicus TaxID=67351 RepID=UPI0033EFAD83